jgi:hypothetical protein
MIYGFELYIKSLIWQYIVLTVLIAGFPQSLKALKSLKIWSLKFKALKVLEFCLNQNFLSGAILLSKHMLGFHSMPKIMLPSLCLRL